MKLTKREAREKRHERIRKKIIGTSERPRLAVFKSLNNMYAQIIDDVSGKTILGIGTTAKSFSKKNAGNCKGAEELGKMVAKEALGKKITSVTFDRSGFKFHGRVKAFAEGTRKGGLKF